jgi:hypothetical protein
MWVSVFFNEHGRRRAMMRMAYSNGTGELLDAVSGGTEREPEPIVFGK